MVYSMTGFGRGTALYSGREYTVEMRSVNSRYFEYSSRLPRSCNFLDLPLKKMLNAKISRGKVEINLSIQTVEASENAVKVDLALAKQYETAIRSISENLDVANGLTAFNISRFPDVLITAQVEVEEEDVLNTVKLATEKALAQFMEMRATEGDRMKTDILNRLISIENAIANIEKQTSGRVQAYTERLYEKLKVLLEDRNIDEARVLTEAAIFADKTAVDEETVRIHSHLAQYKSMLELKEPVGRKLDFLTQELNREVNTIGSKCQDIAITRIVVDIKAEIEKIREQIQNIE